VFPKLCCPAQGAQGTLASFVHPKNVRRLTQAFLGPSGALGLRPGKVERLGRRGSGSPPGLPRPEHGTSEQLPIRQEASPKGETPIEASYRFPRSNEAP
jgi:hypothetical protein